MRCWLSWVCLIITFFGTISGLILELHKSKSFTDFCKSCLSHKYGQLFTVPILFVDNKKAALFCKFLLLLFNMMIALEGLDNYWWIATIITFCTFIKEVFVSQHLFFIFYICMSWIFLGIPYASTLQSLLLVQLAPVL
jgi:hypothetical protein